MCYRFPQSGPRPEDQDEEQDVVEEEAEELEALPDTPYPHIFVIGDSADAFDAIKAGHTAGHTAYWQAGVAARNLICLASVAKQAEQREEGQEGEQGRPT